MTRKSTLTVLAGLAALAFAVAAQRPVTAQRPTGAIDNPLPRPTTHLAWDSYVALLDSGGVPPGEAAFKNPPNPICTTETSLTTSNVSTDCEALAPHNETSIAVNPTNPANLVGGANDYQLKLSAGGTVNETIYSRAHVSFDGGLTWRTVPLDNSRYIATGDPAIAFDASGTVYYATLGFRFGQRSPTGTNADVVVFHSTDGGATWSRPSVVARGTGSFGSVGIFNDKEAIAAWGDGNAIVTFTRFPAGIFGSYTGSPIFATVTHDGGRTWSAPAGISGAAAFCAGFNGGTACDQDQGSVPAVASNGAIYVSFMNFPNDAAGRDQYLVVKLNADGQLVAGPFRVGTIFDGYTDYPLNVSGRETYQDSQFRSWAFGNITVDPTDPSHLAVAWSDMRNSTLPVSRNPYLAVTNSDVIVSQSFDGGQTWSAPAAIAEPNDQFMPWASYGPDGRLRIGYFDRAYDPANHAYGYTLATEGTAGSLTFLTAQLTNQLSDPTQGNRWFSGFTVNPAFPHPTSFLGDYSWVDASQGVTAAYWTDLRAQACFTTRCGHGQDAFFGGF